MSPGEENGRKMKKREGDPQRMGLALPSARGLLEPNTSTPHQSIARRLHMLCLVTVAAPARQTDDGGVWPPKGYRDGE